MGRTEGWESEEVRTPQDAVEVAMIELRDANAKLVSAHRALALVWQGQQSRKRARVTVPEMRRAA